jgi:hypothetical protein
VARNQAGEAEGDEPNLADTDLKCPGSRMCRVTVFPSPAHETTFVDPHECPLAYAAHDPRERIDGSQRRKGSPVSYNAASPITVLGLGPLGDSQRTHLTKEEQRKLDGI